MEKIIIIQTAFLGDLLLTIPTLLRLKALYPKAEITLLCRKGVGEIFRELKIVDVIVEVNKKNRKEFAQKLFEVTRHKYDLLICPHESYRSAFISYQIKATQKIGFKKWWNIIIFNQSVVRNMKLPDALRQLSLLKFDAVSQKVVSEYQRSSNFDDRQIPEIASMGLKERIENHPRHQAIIQKFNLKDDSVFIAPGSVWNTKRWTADGFEQLAQRLSTKPIVFIGSEEERELCQQISTKVLGSVNLAGQTSLFELLTLLSKGRVLISNDSGAMHLGSVAEIPTVAIFGPTVLELGYEPWQQKATVVENKALKCRPCGKHGHMQCPLGTHECMTSISSEMVYAGVKRIVPTL